jgi:hypothetical protein
VMMIKQILKLVLFIWLFLGSASCQQAALTYDLCLHAVDKRLNECSRLNNIYDQGKAYSTIHFPTSDKKNKGKELRFQTVQSDEDELDSLKLKVNNSLIILALVVTEGCFNYYFKNRAYEFHFHNPDLKRQFLSLHVLKI